MGGVVLGRKPCRKFSGKVVPLEVQIVVEEAFPRMELPESEVGMGLVQAQSSRGCCGHTGKGRTLQRCKGKALPSIRVSTHTTMWETMKWTTPRRERHLQRSTVAGRKSATSNDRASEHKKAGRDGRKILSGQMIK